MSRLCRFLLGVVFVLAAARAIEFTALAWVRFRLPLDSFNLEAKMVHLAWRVQHQVELYPEWRSYPHVTNVFGPLYFVVVGLLGRAVGASIDDLYTIGRLVTFGSVVLTSLTIGVVLHRRHGLGAAVFGALINYGTAPMDGFAVMTRSDTMAELLGFLGFVIALQRRVLWGVLGGGLLVLAVLTKQTAGSYLLAVVLALVLERRSGRALGLLAGCGLSLAAIVACVQSFLEPRFIDGLLSAGYSPWRMASFTTQWGRLLKIGLEIPLLALAGLVLWNTGGRRERAWTALAIIQILVALVTTAKHGSDLNYFLSLGIVAGLAAGTLWASAWNGPPMSQRRRRAIRAALGVLAVLMALVVSFPIAFQTLDHGLTILTKSVWGFSASSAGARVINMGAALLCLAAVGAFVARRDWRPDLARSVLALALIAALSIDNLGVILQLSRFSNFGQFLTSQPGREMLAAFRQLHRMAADPSRRLLTDEGAIDIWQGERTVYGDPWLFRLYADIGQIDTKLIQDRIDREEYELVVTRHDLFARTYESYDFGFPMAVVEHLREHYRSLGAAPGGLFFYGPKGGPASRGGP